MIFENGMVPYKKNGRQIVYRDKFTLNGALHTPTR